MRVLPELRLSVIGLFLLVFIGAMGISVLVEAQEFEITGVEFTPLISSGPDETAEMFEFKYYIIRTIESGDGDKRIASVSYKFNVEGWYSIFINPVSGEYINSICTVSSGAGNPLTEYTLWVISRNNATVQLDFETNSFAVHVAIFFIPFEEDSEDSVDLFIESWRDSGKCNHIAEEETE